MPDVTWANSPKSLGARFGEQGELVRQGSTNFVSPSLKTEVCYKIMHVCVNIWFKGDKRKLIKHLEQ